MEKDYYEILGVPKNADEAIVKAAYRDLSKKYHPDMMKPENPRLVVRILIQLLMIL